MSTLEPIAERPERPVQNFSRPLSRDLSSNSTDHQPLLTLRSIHAFHDSDSQTTTTSSTASDRQRKEAEEPPFPTEPRFSDDSSSDDRPTSLSSTQNSSITTTTTTNTTVSPSQIPPARAAPQPPALHQPQHASAPAPRGILKPTGGHSITQVADPSSEDTASHHTVSSSGSGTGSSTVAAGEKGTTGGSFDAAGRWQSSDFDTSGLSEEKRRRLERKGINPALYLEMKAARGEGGGSAEGGKKKRRWVPGTLTGNSYVS